MSGTRLSQIQTESSIRPTPDRIFYILTYFLQVITIVCEGLGRISGRYPLAEVTPLRCQVTDAVSVRA